MRVQPPAHAEYFSALCYCCCMRNVFVDVGAFIALGASQKMLQLKWLKRLITSLVF